MGTTQKVFRSGMVALVGSALAALSLSPVAQAANNAAGLPSGEPTVTELTMPGADPLETDRTIPHWHGQFTDPTNGVTYGFNMAGSDPRLNQDTTIQTDIVPLDFSFGSAGGYQLNGSDVIPQLLASPVFGAADYSHTDHVTSAMDAQQHVSVVPGGELSAGNAGVQYQDAIMRSQFDRIGTSYHLRLAPHVWPAIHINVPAGYGAVFRTPRGAVWGEQNDNQSFETPMSQLHLDPTHLWLLVTNNVFVGHPGHGCCALGFHAAGRMMGYGYGPSSGQGQAQVATWIYAAYLQPGTINPGFAPFDSDVTVFGHELSEWADDPYGDNYVNNWLAPLPPQDGCYPILEVGDPVDRIAFTLPGNSFDTGPYADGYWHFQDEVFLPWVAREFPNVTSQPSQAPSPAGGRYSFMGDLNPYPVFHAPASGC